MDIKRRLKFTKEELDNIKESRPKSSKTKSGKKVPGKYLTKDKPAMKGEIERVSKLKSDDPDAYGNVGNAAVCEALDAEGIGCWVGYESMSDYELFQPHLSRMPVPVQYAKQMDPKGWHTPVADRAAKHEQIYLDENIFSHLPERSRAFLMRASVETSLNAELSFYGSVFGFAPAIA